MAETAPDSAHSLFQIYNASAGAGKTYTLTQNYICDLLAGQSSFQNILAITFTNKAVAEMKSRIIEKLYELSTPAKTHKEQDYLQEISTKTGLSRDKIKEKSQAILRTILHNYAAFEVSTIDGFNHRLLRTFARDLGIPVNFEVELDTDEILEEAVDGVISKIGTPGEESLTRATVQFALSKVDDDRSWDISYDLNEIAKLLVNDNDIEPLEKLLKDELSPEDFDSFNRQLSKEINTLSRYCQKTAKNFFDLIAQNGVDPENFHRNSIPKFFNKIRKGDFKNFPPTKKPTWAINIDNPEFTKYYKKDEEEAVKQVMDRLRPAIAKLYFELEEKISKIKFYKNIRKANPSLALLSAIKKEVSAIKNDRDLLLISEFNKTISNSLQGENPAFIYERLGEKYNTFYIDEFQDTSEMQWGNLRPLIENSLAQGGKLTIVGDVKQSIYRWRGGKAEQFMALWEEKNSLINKKTLAYNYRSRSEIVQFNNAFFKLAASSLDFEPYRTLFENTKQNPVRGNGGYVNISFIDGTNKEEKNEKYPLAVLKIINGQKNKGYAYKDIGVLVRKKEQGVAIADYLSQQGIPIVSSETLLLINSKTINLIIAILRFSLHPMDQNLKFEILNRVYPKIDLFISSYDFISAGLRNNGDHFFEYLKEYGFQFRLKNLQVLPLYDAVEYCLQAFNLQNDKNEVAYLQFFLDFVYEYVQTYAGGIAGFLELWDSKKEKLSITSPEGANGVQILTIHKAKGLSFPIVIYPYAEEKLDDTSQDSAWIDLQKPFDKIPVTYQKVSSQLPHYSEEAKSVYEIVKRHTELDTMNICYVAMTRAEEKLYVLSNYLPKKSKKKEASHTEGSKKFPEILVSFLIQENLWDENKADKSFDFGQNQTKFPDDQSIQAQDTYEEDNLTRFLSSSPRDHAINIVTKSDLLWESGQDKPLQAGNIFHKFLEKIFYSSDIDKVLKEAIANGDISRSQQEKYATPIRALVEDPRLTSYFSRDYHIYTEKEILIDGEYKRLDRLCLKGEEAVIIDYKTGETHEHYKNQINAYAQAVENIGYHVRKKLIVYIDKDGFNLETIA